MFLGIMRPLIVKEVLVPALSVTAIISIMYFANWIPPVPLSIQHLGVYHNIEKNNGEYMLSYEKPWWRIWDNSDQNFAAYDGDKIYGFARIFSPVGFADKVIFHWLYKDQRGEWVTAQKISVPIRGGRGHGFRAYTYKENYAEGHWILKIETLGGKEIGETKIHVKRKKGSRSEPFKIHKF